MTRKIEIALSAGAMLGEDITETLEVIPRQWKVIQTVREKFSCRAVLRAGGHRHQ